MKKIQLSKLARLAEIAAAIGVIISLIFIGLQLRSNTEATEAATRAAINQNDVDFLSLSIDSSVLAKAMAKAQRGEELSALEESQLVHLELVNFVSFEHSFYQYRKGLLEEPEWLRHRNLIEIGMKHWPHSRTMWERSRGVFTPEFQQLVDSLVSE